MKCECNSSLTFEELKLTNYARCNTWHNLTDWSLSDWGVAMAGEAGEVCNAIKKLNRLYCNIQQNHGPKDEATALAELANEIGDTLLYLDLLAQRAGLSLEECVRNTFNRVSHREDLPFKL